MKKLTQREKNIRKEEFFKEWSYELIKLTPTPKFYNHFIKVEIAGIEYDYYPGPGSLNNVIVKGSAAWTFNVSHEDFLKLVGLGHKINFSKEEIDLFDEWGIVSGEDL